MKPELQDPHRVRVIIGVTVLLAVAALVGWLVYAQFSSTSDRDGQTKYSHPVVEASQSCTSCKVSSHDYRHLQPYTGTCERCHTTASWRNIHYTHLDHDFNTSLHDVIGCDRCHTEGKPSPSKACETCHVKKSPHNSGAVACGACHTAVAWLLLRPIPADHLSLEGGHAGLSCFECHKAAPSASGTARGCVDCHGKKHGGLSDCERCHEPSRGWDPLPGFDHNAFFRLAGAHKALACVKCHSNGKFAGTSSDCVDCHGTHHGGLTRCNDCHSPSTGWRAINGFDHSVFYPLVGKHRSVACAQCHTNGRFAGTPRVCSGCHKVVHTGLSSCQKCHTPSGFIPSTFNHSAYFKLTGRHTSVACSGCHPRGKYNGTPTRCSGCHGARHGGLTQCQDCHTTAGFRPSTFVHSKVFALSGAHAKLACNKCHPNNRYAENIGGGGTACSSCHDGPHGAGYSTCSNCHTTTAWVPTKPITHPGYIKLGAAHSSRSCRLCHSSLQFSAATTPCQQSGCHAATIPHVGPTVCLNCHRPTTWAELHFTHPELGIHAGTNLNQQCLWCHPGRDYTKWDCKTCHVQNGIPWSEP